MNPSKDTDGEKAAAPAPVTGTSPDGAWRYTVGPDGAMVWTPVAAAKPKPQAKPKGKAKPAPKAKAAAPATDAELSASASKVMDGLKAVGMEEWDGLKKRARGVAEIFLDALDGGLKKK